MRIIAKNTTEVLNYVYGDEEDYDYISENDLAKLMDNYIDYLADLENDAFEHDDLLKYDNGYLGDIMNLLLVFKTKIEWRDE